MLTGSLKNSVTYMSSPALTLNILPASVAAYLWVFKVNAWGSYCFLELLPDTDTQFSNRKKNIWRQRNLAVVLQKLACNELHVLNKTEIQRKCFPWQQ